MLTDELPVHVKKIKRALERVWPSVRAAGSDEQRQLLGAMYDTLTLAERLYYEVPDDGEEAWNQWRHDVIRPLSLCINSSELLLTDPDNPLSDAQRQDIQTVFDEAVQLGQLIDELYNQRVHP
ncbi:MAG TPA: hypothetical protein VKY59_21070 [Spirillospora sp.]|nr:hypothetical protein [Spirillospora sp.]